jgi:hypothetical protein
MEGKTTKSLKRNTEARLCVSKKGGVDENAESLKYIFTSRSQNAAQNHNTETSTGSFEKVAKLKYTDAIPTNQNYIHKEIKNRFSRIMFPTV